MSGIKGFIQARTDFLNRAANKGDAWTQLECGKFVPNAGTYVLRYSERPGRVALYILQTGGVASEQIFDYVSLEAAEGLLSLYTRGLLAGREVPSVNVACDFEVNNELNSI